MQRRDSRQQGGRGPEGAPALQRALKAVLASVRTVLLLLSLLYILLMVVVVSLRCSHPFQLEWVEGAVLEQVVRLLEGRPLYVAPSLEFAPLIYPPLYYCAGAVSVALLGPGLPALRLVSLLATLGSVLLLYLIVRRETGAWEPALLASGLFAATYPLSGAWLDLARVDGLALALILAGLYAARWATDTRGALAAGALLALATMTKQSAAIVAASILVGMALASPRRGIFGTAAFVVLAGGPSTLLHLRSGGWFTYYLATMGSEHAVDQEVLITFWSRDLLRALPILCGLGLIYLLRGARREARASGPRFFLLAMLGVLGASWLSRLHVGGFVNVLAPVHALLAMVTALAAFEAGLWPTDPDGGSLPASLAPGSVAPMAVAVVVLIQLLGLRYDPRPLVPSREDAAAMGEVQALVGAIEGDLLIPAHGYLATAVGKPSHAHEAAIWDILRAGEGPIQQALRAEIQEALRSRRFAAVLLDNVDFLVHARVLDVDECYHVAGRLLVDTPAGWTLTGARRRPRDLLLPRPPQDATGQAP